jgi:hypothetical protein
MRERFAEHFKATVALEAVKGNDVPGTRREVSVHPNQISTEKKLLPNPQHASDDKKD